jgi:hypothetical protein
MLTVGMPMFRTKKIGWLALEGLCRQREAPAWELIVIEETPERYEPFGRKRIFDYELRLKKVNCQRIVYEPLDHWEELSLKWRRIAELAEGDILVLQAADCYGQPYRLRNTAALMADPAIDWYQAPKGYFYLIKTDEVFEFTNANLPHPCALNMAMRMKWVRLLPAEQVAYWVDGWLYNSIDRIKRAAMDEGLQVVWDTSEDWRLGVDTHGLDNLSISREQDMRNSPQVWIPRAVKLEQIIPGELAEWLRGLQGNVRLENEYRKWE